MAIKYSSYATIYIFLLVLFKLGNHKMVHLIVEFYGLPQSNILSVAEANLPFPHCSFSTRLFLLFLHRLGDKSFILQQRETLQQRSRQIYYQNNCNILHQNPLARNTIAAFQN